MALNGHLPENTFLLELILNPGCHLPDPPSHRAVRVEVGDTSPGVTWWATGKATPVLKPTAEAGARLLPSQWGRPAPSTPDLAQGGRGGERCPGSWGGGACCPIKGPGRKEMAHPEWV